MASNRKLAFWSYPPPAPLPMPFASYQVLFFKELYELLLLHYQAELENSYFSFPVKGEAPSEKVFVLIQPHYPCLQIFLKVPVATLSMAKKVWNQGPFRSSAQQADA